MKAAIFRFVLAMLTLISIGYWIELGAFDSLSFSFSVVFGIASLAEFITYCDNCGSYTKTYEKEDYRKGIISRFFIK